jgi:plasmid stabilization system protein ParE
MRLVRHNIRLPASLDSALRSLAKHQGTSAYAVLQQCVQAGLAALAHQPLAGVDDPEIVGELASLGTRIVDIERLLDRTLFTACAAYAYARSAALGARKSDEVITAETHVAYDRQRRLSQETDRDQ